MSLDSNRSDDDKAKDVVFVLLISRNSRQVRPWLMTGCLTFAFWLVFFPPDKAAMLLLVSESASVVTETSTQFITQPAKLAR